MNLTDEERAALERLRACRYPDGSGYDLRGYSESLGVNNFCLDREIAVEIALREHPEDEGE